jgi:predicted HTH domain antitoxin
MFSPNPAALSWVYFPLAIGYVHGAMKTLTIQYDEGLPSDWGESPAAFEMEARLLLGLKLFELGRISAGKAAEFAGLAKRDFLVKASALGVPVARLDEDQLAAVFANAWLHADCGQWWDFYRNFAVPSACRPRFPSSLMLTGKPQAATLPRRRET